MVFWLIESLVVAGPGVDPKEVSLKGLPAECDFRLDGLPGLLRQLCRHPVVLLGQEEKWSRDATTATLL